MSVGISPTSKPAVFVVEDDVDMRTSLNNILTNAKFDAQCFCSPAEFLDYYEPEMAGCLVLDFQLPEMDGLTLYNRLKALNRTLPFIVISGYATVPRVLEAFHLGAIDFLEKPFGRAQFLEKVTLAVNQDVSERRRRDERSRVLARLALLTPRESEVTRLLVEGLATSEIATKLGISPKTAHNHRARILAKMQVHNVPKLLRLINLEQ